MQSIMKNLKSEIAKQASLDNGVSIIENFSNYNELDLQAQKCNIQLQSDPELQLLAGKIALSGGANPTMAMLVDETKPTDIEKPLITKFASKKEKCLQGYKTFYSFVPNDENNLFLQEYMNDFNLLLVKLYKEVISYGDFAQGTKELSIQAGKKDHQRVANQNAQQQNETELERQHQLDQQRINIEEMRALAIQNQANKVLPLPTIQQTKPANCTSTAIGNTIQTICY